MTTLSEAVVAPVTTADQQLVHRLAAALHGLCRATGNESEAEGDAIWAEADAALLAYHQQHGRPS